MASEESSTPALGRLLGWNNAQKAIDGLTKTINDLNRGLQGVKPGVGGLSSAQGAGATLRDVWNGGSTHGSQTRGRANGGGVSFSGGGKQPPGQRYDDELLGGGRSGGAVGGAGLGAAFGALSKYNSQHFADRTIMQTAAYQAVQNGGSISWQGAADTFYGRNSTAHGREDAATAGSMLARSGVQQSQYKSLFPQIASTGLINPGITNTMTMSAFNSARTAGSYNSMRMFGVRTIGPGGQAKSPRAIANDILSKIPGSSDIKTPEQITANLDDPTGGINQTLQNWVSHGYISPDLEQVVREEIRGILISRQHGMSYAKYDSTMNAANKMDKGALKTLGKMNIGSSSTSQIMRYDNKMMSRDNDSLGSFARGVSDATNVLGDFRDALSKILDVTHAGNALAYSSPWAGLAGTAVSGTVSGGMGMLGAYGAYRMIRGGGSIGKSASAARAAAAGAAGAAARGAQAAGSAGKMASMAAKVGRFAGPLSLIGVGQGGRLDPYESYKGPMDPTLLKMKKSNPGMYQQFISDAPVGWGEGAAPENGFSPSVRDGKSEGGGSGGANAANAIAMAKKYLGMPYKWGGESPQTSFDCSGLMQYVFGRLGVNLPRTAKEQQRAGSEVDKKDIRPGDLVFWGKPAHHVAMVVSPGKIIEAPRTGKNVRIRNFSLGEITNARRVLGSVGSVTAGSMPNETAGVGSGPLSTTGGKVGGDTGAFGGIMGGSGNYGSQSELDALMSGSGISAILPSGTGGQTGGASSGGLSSAGAAPSNPSGNAALGRKLAAAHGWTGAQWDALYTLWNKESSWSNTAQNPTSSAFGIAQFLNSTWAPYGKKSSDAATQIKYGMKYIEDRYGDPSKAWSFWQKHNWYDKGAWEITDDQNARVHKGEMIIPARDADTIRQAILKDVNPGKADGSSGGTYTFQQGSIVFKIDGAMDTTSARKAADEFKKAMQADNIQAVATGRRS